MPFLSEPELAAARALAVKTVGGRTVTRLEAAGLIVVRREDVRTVPHVYVEEDVRISIPEDWTDPWPINVDGIQKLDLHVAPEAVDAVREAASLQAVMGYRVDVEIDEAAQLVMRVWTRER